MVIISVGTGDFNAAPSRIEIALLNFPVKISDKNSFSIVNFINYISNAFADYKEVAVLLMVIKLLQQGVVG